MKRCLLSGLSIFLVAGFANYPKVAKPQDSEQAIVKSFERLVERAIEKNNHHFDLAQQYNEDTFKMATGMLVLLDLPTESSEKAKEQAYFNKEKLNIGKWYRNIIELKDIGFDVQKTSSLVSPYAGIATGFVREGRTRCFGTKEQAQAAIELDETGSVFGSPFRKFKLEYAYQNGKWVLKRGFCESSEGQWDSVWDGEMGTADHSWGLHYDCWNII